MPSHWGVRASVCQLWEDTIQPVISNFVRLVFHRQQGKAHLVALNLIRGFMGEGWGLLSISACTRMFLVVAEEEKEHVVDMFFKIIILCSSSCQKMEPLFSPTPPIRA